MRLTRAAALATALIAVLLLPTPARAATNDPYRNLQWGLTKIKAEEAWGTSTGTGALIAIVDTGVDLTHPDLDGNLVVFSDADFVEPGGTCTGSKRNRTCTQDGPADKNGHGTHVAGIAGAETNNGIGVAGTAPGARLLAVRVLDAEGSGTADQIAAGVRYAADKGADVINLSLGFLSGVDQVVKVIGELDPVYAAIDYAWSKGSVIVIAAGNDTFPLCAEPSAHPNALCVGATDSRDLRSWFSNNDATMSSDYVVAPGGDGLTCASDIYSTYWRGASTFCGPTTGYESLSGTSMATPFVSGVAGLLAAKGLTNSQIVQCITATADDLGVPGRDPNYGYGRVNAQRAVTSC